MTIMTVVHVVDQDGEARRQAARVLEAGGCEVRSFASAGEFLAEGLPARPDCVVAETALECSGLELQERINERDGTAGVVFLTGKCDFRVVVRAMRAGAIDFLEKPAGEAVLLDAVARAAERCLALRAEASLRSTAMERFGRLTPRERDIFAQVLQGRLNKQIAAELDCQEATVKVHRSRLMRKLGVRSLARLVQFGQQIGAT